MQILNTYMELSLNTWETTVFQAIHGKTTLSICSLSMSTEDLKTLLEGVDCLLLMESPIGSAVPG